MTNQRQVIVGVIGDAEDHPDVDELYRRAVHEDNTISIATVYRTVKLLKKPASSSVWNSVMAAPAMKKPVSTMNISSTSKPAK